MTVEEKIMQLNAIYKDPVMDDFAKEDGTFNPKKAHKVMRHGMGRMSTPFKTFTPEPCAKVTNQLQDFLTRKTRLGIPLFIDCEGIHGTHCIGSTMFPVAMAQAATWNPPLIEEMAGSIASEIRSRGMHAVFAPVIDVCRDLRAGRTQETFGEDPYLVARMGVAYVKGVQRKRIIATVKHFTANFVGDGGRDSHPIHYSERLLREVYLPPYEACIREANALSVMSAYHTLDGVPCTANKWLLTDLLREEYKFKGHVVSDWFATAIIHTHHRAAATKAEAAMKSLNAGLDVEVPVTDCFLHLGKLIKSGEVSLKVLDNAVWNVLYAKFWVGLFDHPFVDEKATIHFGNNTEGKKTALVIAQQSMVLLKNEKILPLRRSIKSIAVIGPHAMHDNQGAYSCTGTPSVTPLDGIRALAPKGVSIKYAQGCEIQNGTRDNIAAAVALARRADVCILCVGNSADTECEGKDRSNLDLPGFQDELVRKVSEVNKACVVVLFGGGAMTVSHLLPKIAGLLHAWYPGQEGGTALAEILFGAICPGGKLPFTYPKTTGQLPMYYNAKPSGRIYDYHDLRGTQPLFPFGFGLSYTTFEYSNLAVRKSGKGKNLSVAVSCEVKNTGKCSGDEIVQLYIHDEYSSRSRPPKELKKFERVSLKPKQKLQVAFNLAAKDFSFLNDRLKPVLEPGDFEIMLGSSSEDVRLKKTIRL
jgi:beta-glucosidase